MEAGITCGQQLTGMNNANLREFCSNYWLGCIPVSREELLQERSLGYADVAGGRGGETATIETGRTRTKKYK